MELVQLLILGANLVLLAFNIIVAAVFIWAIFVAVKDMGIGPKSFRKPKNKQYQ